MAMVDIQFGGEVACTWATLQNTLQVYEAISTQYGLSKPSGAVVLSFNQQTDELEGLAIRWVLKDYNHTNLGAFFETWGLISTQYNIRRYDMVISDSTG